MLLVKLLTLVLTACSLLSTSVVVAQRSIDSVADIPEAETGLARAYFDSGSGDIYLSVGDNLTIVGLRGAPFGFVSGVFDETIVSQNTGLGGTDANNENEIAWAVVTGSLSTGIFNIGNLLPPEDRFLFSAEEFDIAYPDAELVFAGPGNGNQVPLNFISAPVQRIPEPGSAGLWLLAGMVFSARRRRSHLKSK